VRPFVAVLLVLCCAVAGPSYAATRAGSLSVTAAVVDRCVILQTSAQSAQVRCDRGVPYRIERRAMTGRADPAVRVMGTVIIY